MRVLSFTTIYPNQEQTLHGLFVRERVSALAKLCEVEVVAPVPWTPLAAALSARHQSYARVPAREEQSGITVHHPRFLTIPKVLKTGDGWLMAESCRAGVRALRRRFLFDIIDAHWGVPDGVAAAVLARALRVPVSITVRGDDVNVFGEERGRGRALRWALRRADLVIALSSELATKVEAWGVPPDRVRVVSNGIDPARFRPVDRLAARRRLQIGAGERLIVSAGRLHASKGFPTIVEAAAGLANVRVAILGNDDCEAPAAAAIREAGERTGMRERVLLPGSQSPDALVDWYSAADVFCLPTAREGSANVLLEALACGLPCVTTPVGGNPDVITPGNGLLVPADSESIAAALGRALDRSWDRGAISAQARRRTWDVVAAECHAALARVVAAGSQQAA